MLAEMAAFCEAAVQWLQGGEAGAALEAVTPDTDEDVLEARISYDRVRAQLEARVEAAEAERLLELKMTLDGLVKLNLAVSSLAEDSGTLARAAQCRAGLVRVGGLGGLASLYTATLPPLLSSLAASCAAWSPVSPGLAMLRTLLTECGEVGGHFPGTVVR